MKPILSILSFIAGLTTTTASAGPDISFRAEHDYLAIGAMGAAVGDFNGDARPDVAITNAYRASVTVFLNGLGASRLDVGQYPLAIAVSDVNGDSRLDLIVLGSGSSDVAVLLGRGDGTFEPARYFPVGDHATSIAVGDFDGDNAPDVVVGGGEDPNTWMLLGSGDGTLGSATSVGLPDPTWGLSVGDFDGDGDLDIVATVYHRLAILSGNGDGTFLQPNYVDTGQNRAIVAADFDGDGALDIATEMITPFPSMDVGVGVFVGNGDGTFQAPIFTRSAQPLALAVGDFNNDLKPDLAVAANGYAQVLLGAGNGRLQEPLLVLANGSTIAVAELNGDSNADLLTANFGTLSFRFGKGDGTFHQTPGLRTGVETSAVASADVNGDGTVDLAAALGDGTPYLAVILGNGDGTFRPSPAVLPISFHVTTMAWGDFDGDTRLDLVAAGSYPAPGGVYLFTGNGDGSLAPPQLIMPASGANLVITSDLTGDDTLDLVVVDSYAGVAVLPGNGDSTFQDPIPVTAGLNPHDGVLADFNGDGASDLAIANYNSGTVSVVFGNGDGTFQPPADTAVGAYPYSIDAADFNRDGKMDLVLSTQVSMYVQVLLGAGDGTFAPAVGYYSGDTPGTAVRVADLNGDGVSDVAALGADTLSILVGNGDGTLRVQMTGFSTVFSADEMVFADFTSDGRLDVAVAGDGRTLVSAAGIGIALLYNATPSSRNRLIGALGPSRSLLGMPRIQEGSP